MEFFNRLMGFAIRDIGKMIKNMVKVLRNGQMAVSMKEALLMGKKME